jgi:hypothetical protein
MRMIFFIDPVCGWIWWTPSGRWRRLRVARHDPWEPGARRDHRTVWSWWCP